MTEQSDPGQRAWNLRGHELSAADFTTAMVHFYRGEMGRANIWRTRLDATTNWAVITVAAALTFVFGGPQNPHFVFLLVLLLVLTFLMIEARRYRYYALWVYRVHLMETNFFAAIFTPLFCPSSDWGDRLAESLNHPAFPIALWKAVGRRFSRNYAWLIALLLISWGTKLALHPTLAPDATTVVTRAAVGTIPGAWVMAVVGTMYVALVVLAVVAFLFRAWPDGTPALQRRAAGPWAPQHRRRERMATIITRCGQAVASHLLEELGRGVTALEGTGMYTGEAWDVLLCAVTDVQVLHLEEIVQRVDPEAFVVVSPAEAVRGRGFRPFEPPS